MLSRLNRSFVCVSLAALFLSACGNTGALYLPGQEGDPNLQTEQREQGSQSTDASNEDA